MNVALLAFSMTIETLAFDGQKTVERVDVPETSATASFRLTRQQIVSRKARRIALLPDFATAKKGDDGYWVVSTGQLGTFRCDKGRFVCSSPSMSMFGMKTPRRTFVAIVKSLKYYFKTEVEAKGGAYAMRCVLDGDLCEEPYEDFEIEFRTLEGPEANYAGMARAYRKYQLDRGAMVPLRERIRENSILKEAVEGPEVRIRQAWKPVPSPIPDQVPENEPAIKRAVVSFDRVGDIAREMKRQGVGKAELCLVGWNIGGHDGRWPQSFPVEPALGGEARLRQCIKDTLACGYLIVPHGNYRDCYRIAEGFDLEYLVKDRNGDPIQAHSQFWGAGRQYQACPLRGYERYSFREMPRMAALGFKGMGYFDVVTILKAPKCDDPRHPLNRAESARYWGKSAEVSRQFFGGFASEGSLDHFVGSLDSVLYASFGDPRKTNTGLVDRITPIWQMVYGGFVVNNPFTTTINFTAQDGYSRLKLLEFGGRPNFYFYSKFVDDGTDWMGKGDLGCATDEELRASVAKIKSGWDVYSRVSHLQYEFIEGHEERAPGVWCTTYSNGEKVYVNYNRQAVEADGVRIDAEDWRLVQAAVSSGALAQPRMVAHRGAGDLKMPEASLEAYSNAVATASDIVKLDLQKTKDGVIVMGHDLSLRRVMGWNAKIDDLTYSDIFEKGRFLVDKRPGNARIVRLDQALPVLRAVPEFWIDFKHFDAEFAERVLDEFKKAGIDRSRVMVATFSQPALGYFLTHHPSVRRVGHISLSRKSDGSWTNSCEEKRKFASKAEAMESVLEYCRRFGLFGVNMPVCDWQTTVEDIRALKEHGLWVSLWFVQNGKTADHFRNSGADAFVTDFVSKVRTVARKVPPKQEPSK